MLRYLSLAIYFTTSLAWAQTFDFPKTPAPVVDQAGVLTERSERLLEGAFRDLKKISGNEISVLTVQSLGGLTIEQAAIQVYDRWKLGSEANDNGVLFLIAPRERKVRIEVGQGLEGAVPDATASRIVQDIVLPAFRQGSLEDGIVMGSIEIMRRTDPGVDLSQILQGVETRQVERRSPRRGTPAWLNLVVFIFIILSVFSRRGRRSRGTAALIGYGLGSLGSGRSSGWGGGSGGGGSWGGGGRSSGGGASGSW